MPDPETLTFEQALTRLEEVVEQLDGGETSLDEALKLFEEGMALKQLCLQRLTEAEARVEQYVEAEAEEGDE